MATLIQKARMFATVASKDRLSAALRQIADGVIAEVAPVSPTGDQMTQYLDRKKLAMEVKKSPTHWTEVYAPVIMGDWQVVGKSSDIGREDLAPEEEEALDNVILSAVAYYWDTLTDTIYPS